MSMLSKMFALAFISKVAAIEPNPPQWNTKRVKIFTPGQPDAQSILDAINKEQGGHDPVNNGEFSDDRYALLFQPGTHYVNVDVGFYTTVHGLGKTPGETTLGNLICQNGGFQMEIGALDNFWRGAENVRVTGKMIWAASQASPLRRMMVEGDLDLFQYNPPNTGAGYASGGFMADSTITGKITSGSQQQYFTRNSFMGKWETGVWNMVFLGNQNAPANHCGNDFGNVPATTVDVTPTIVEKPYIVSKGSTYSLMIPKLEKNKVGPTAGYNNADEVPFENVYVANENDTVEVINSKLEEGLHLLLQPGQYNLQGSIKVTKPNTVVLGIGLATLISSNGEPCIEVSNVDGVKVSGILLQAGSKNTESLLKWGDGTYKGSAENPGVIHDVFARVGGPDLSEVSASIMVQVNSGNVIIDDVWLWRADHSKAGLIKSKANPVKTGLQVNGDDVTGYGVACEHTLEHLLEWNGENGKTYFYQSEFPYDVDQSYGDSKFSSYKVGENVSNHEAWGTGVYSYFRDYTVAIDSAIQAPKKAGVKFHNALSVFLNGNGEISHVINEDGNKVNTDSHLSYVCEWGGQAAEEQAPFSIELIQ